MYHHNHVTQLSTTVLHVPWDGKLAPPSPKAHTLNVRAISVVAKWLDGLR